MKQLASVNGSRRAFFLPRSNPGLNANRTEYRAGNQAHPSCPKHCCSRPPPPVEMLADTHQQAVHHRQVRGVGCGGLGPQGVATAVAVYWARRWAQPGFLCDGFQIHLFRTCMLLFVNSPPTQAHSGLQLGFEASQEELFHRSPT